MSGFELGPSGRQPGNIGKDRGAARQKWVSGWQVLPPVVLPSALVPLWSPGGMLAEPQNLPSLPLPFGNLLWWHFSPNKPWVSRSLGACPSCSSHSETCFSSAAGKSCSSFKDQFLSYLLCESPRKHSPSYPRWAIPSPASVVLSHHHKTSMHIWCCCYLVEQFVFSFFLVHVFYFMICILCITFSQIIIEGSKR